MIIEQPLSFISPPHQSYSIEKFKQLRYIIPITASSCLSKFYSQNKATVYVVACNLYPFVAYSV